MHKVTEIIYIADFVVSIAIQFLKMSSEICKGSAEQGIEGLAILSHKNCQ